MRATVFDTEQLVMSSAKPLFHGETPAQTERKSELTMRARVIIATNTRFEERGGITWTKGDSRLNSLVFPRLSLSLRLGLVTDAPSPFSKYHQGDRD